MSKRQAYPLTDETSPKKSALHAHVRQMLTLERLCSRFQLVAQQLQSRHNQRATLRVDDEYDVQDLLQALLTVEYDDIRREEWTPSYASGSSRKDFLLKLEQIVIIAKQTRSDLGSKEVGKRLAVDVRQYQQHPACKTLVYFIYDPEGRIANPRGLENDLSGDQDGLVVRVMIAPKSLSTGRG